MMSPLPPGAYGRTTRIGFSGYAALAACAATSAATMQNLIRGGNR
jgi:hypothetical protein